MFRRHISSSVSALVMAAAALAADFGAQTQLRGRSVYAPRPTPPRYRRKRKSREARPGRLIRGAFTGKRTTPDHEVPTKHLSSAARQRRALAKAIARAGSC